MTIATEIQKLQTNLENAYTKCSSKGATLPANQNFDNLSTTIGTIPASITYTEQAHYKISNAGVVSLENTLPDLSGIKIVGDKALNYAFAYYPSTVTGIPDVSNIEEIGEQGMQRCFQNCTGLSGTLQFSKLTTVKRQGLMYAFGLCSNISGVSFPLLKSCYAQSLQYAFTRTAITSIEFTSLDYVSGGNVFMNFIANSSVNSVSFPALKTTSFVGTTCFSNMLTSTTNCTVHFPSNLQTTIQGLSGYPTFGGTTPTLLFDLPATT